MIALSEAPTPRPSSNLPDAPGASVLRPKGNSLAGGGEAGAEAKAPGRGIQPGQDAEGPPRLLPTCRGSSKRTRSITQTHSLHTFAQTGTPAPRRTPRNTQAGAPRVTPTPQGPTSPRTAPDLARGACLPDLYPSQPLALAAFPHCEPWEIPRGQGTAPEWGACPHTHLLRRPGAGQRSTAVPHAGLRPGFAMPHLCALGQGPSPQQAQCPRLSNGRPPHRA